MILAVDARFDDLEQFSETVRDWDLDFKLLDNGGFSGQLRQLVSPDILVGYARFERRLHQAGATPEGFKTFVIPASGCREFWWRGCQVTGSEILAFPYGGELLSASQPDFEVYLISVRDSLLVRLAEELGLSGTRLLHDQAEVIPVEAEVLRELRFHSRSILGSAAGDQQTADARVLAERLILLAGRCHNAGRRLQRKRDRALDHVVEYLRSKEMPTVELGVLCRIGQVSERTLEYAFKERYGITPGEFAKRWRLNTVRRRLLKSVDGSTRVGEVATSCGFWHQSQFAADYRRLFSERPSDTLRRGGVVTDRG